MRGLIGYPLRHSYSKQIQEYINQKEYDLIELDETQFHTFMKEKKFECINVTIPYKQKVLPYLDEIEPSAKNIGAVNCIVNRNGKLIGYNSDYYGFRWMLENHNFDIRHKNVAILGTGGASRAVYEAVKDMGAQDIYIVSRTARSGCISYDELYQTDIQCIVNTTPVGMFPDNDGCVVDLDRFSSLSYVADIVYNPLRTRLVIEAEKRGIKAIAGLEMLVGQAVKAIEFFDNVLLPQELVSECTHMLQKEKRNLVLIGMPGCGKSTIGKELGKRLHSPFIDIDAEITKEIQMSIKEYFTLYGEDAFRKKETDVIRRLRNENRCIISCGGGVVKNEKNIDYLKENGTILFIDRPLERLVTTDDRPLSSNRADLTRLYEERYDLYKNNCDIMMKNNRTLNQIVQEIIERLV